MHRRRRVQTAMRLVVLVLVLATVARVAGVGAPAPSGAPSADRPPAEVYDRYMVQLPHAGERAELESAIDAAESGGEVEPGAGPGGWVEVELGRDRTEAAVEEVLGAVDVTALEPVEPRRPYADAVAPETHEDVPGDGEDPGAGQQPEAHDDPPSIGPEDADNRAVRAEAMLAPRFSDQWALQQPSDEDLDAPEAWRLEAGDPGTVVAVIDTGVDGRHPDLAGQLLPGRNFSGSATGAQHDAVGHGTAVASIVAARGTGMAGIAPGVRILPLKVFADSATRFSMSGYLQAIRHAADVGADVVVISLGCGGTVACRSDAELDALEYARDRGVLVVAAAGNGDRDGRALDNDDPATPDYPSGYAVDNLVSVTASSAAGTRPHWANYGSTTVDVAAPGDDVVVAAAGGGWRLASGTSFSAPYAGGIAALMLSRDPGLTLPALRSRLLEAVDPRPAFAGGTVTGGVLNAARAVGAPEIAQELLAVPRPLLPAAGAASPVAPAFTWALPAGWASRAVIVRSGARAWTVATPPAAERAAAPRDAWQAGRYTWQLVAVDQDGGELRLPTRAWAISPLPTVRIAGARSLRAGRAVGVPLPLGGNVASLAVSVRVYAGGRPIARQATWRVSNRPFMPVLPTFRALRRGEPLVIDVTVVGGGRAVRARVVHRVA